VSTDITFVLRLTNEEVVDEELEVLEEEEDSQAVFRRVEEIDLDKKYEPSSITSSCSANIDTPASSLTNPQKVGVLGFKKDKKKKFETHYFIKKGPWLYHYKAKSDKKAQGVFRLEKAQKKVYDPVDDKEKKSKEYQFTFELTNDGETWYLKCDSETGMKSWMQTLDNLSDSENVSGPKGTESSIRNF
jgi:hypothetical protein